MIVKKNEMPHGFSCFDIKVNRTGPSRSESLSMIGGVTGMIAVRMRGTVDLGTKQVVEVRRQHILKLHFEEPSLCVFDGIHVGTVRNNSATSLCRFLAAGEVPPFVFSNLAYDHPF